GQGKRQVRVGYVVENPIWKTSYRLVLGENSKAHLQGWAMVENTSDDDWTNVRMALVSGRPISFQMDLYQPLYVPRPTVEPERFASLRPPTYNAAMGDASQPAKAKVPSETLRAVTDLRDGGLVGNDFDTAEKGRAKAPAPRLSYEQLQER